MGRTINHREAVDYLDRIEDPIVRALIEHAYSKMFTEDLDSESDIDVLFFFKVMEAFLRDRERLARVLLGERNSDGESW